MNTNTLIYIVIGLQVLILGLCFSCFRWSGAGMMRFGSPSSNMHMMSDGSMMSNTHPDMQSVMMDMTGRMEGKTGDELDKVFLEDMIIHHEGAVDMARELQKGTKRPELQKMAKDIISVQTGEITMMKAWLAEWFGATN